MEKEHLLYQIFFQKFSSYKRYQDFKGNANNDNFTKDKGMPTIYPMPIIFIIK